MMNSGLPSHYNNSFSSWFHEDTLRVRLKNILALCNFPWLNLVPAENNKPRVQIKPITARESVHEEKHVSRFIQL